MDRRRGVSRSSCRVASPCSGGCCINTVPSLPHILPCPALAGALLRPGIWRYCPPRIPRESDNQRPVESDTPVAFVTVCVCHPRWTDRLLFQTSPPGRVVTSQTIPDDGSLLAAMALPNKPLPHKQRGIFESRPGVVRQDPSTLRSEDPRKYTRTGRQLSTECVRQAGSSAAPHAGRRMDLRPQSRLTPVAPGPAEDDYLV